MKTMEDINTEILNTVLEMFAGSWHVESVRLMEDINKVANSVEDDEGVEIEKEVRKQIFRTLRSQIA